MVDARCFHTSDNVSWDSENKEDPVIEGNAVLLFVYVRLRKMAWNLTRPRGNIKNAYEAR